MNTKKTIASCNAAAIVLILLTLIPAMAGAEESDSSGSVTASTDLKLQASTMPEVKVGVTQGFTFPFLQGSGPLTQDNNIKLSLTAELSPISLNGIGEALWTPIAFLQVAAGGRVGSGWVVPGRVGLC
jgi:hypothetical protein